jgi:hypothetical protein
MFYIKLNSNILTNLKATMSTMQVPAPCSSAYFAFTQLTLTPA